MTTGGQRSDAAPAGTPAPRQCREAVPVRTGTLRKRSEFLDAARAVRQGTAAFTLQARRRSDAEPASGVRVGFTCSRKVGNAVVRNRARRRLREVARRVLPCDGHEGWDYVLVGRPGATVVRDFEALTEDLRQALRRIHTRCGRARG